MAHKTTVTYMVHDEVDQTTINWDEAFEDLVVMSDRMRDASRVESVKQDLTRVVQIIEIEA